MAGTPSSRLVSFQKIDDDVGCSRQQFFAAATQALSGSVAKAREMRAD
jgi:hypothetical protein